MDRSVVFGPDRDRTGLDRSSHVMDGGGGMGKRGEGRGGEERRGEEKGRSGVWESGWR